LRLAIEPGAQPDRIDQYAQHRDLYRQEPQISLEQVFFSAPPANPAEMLTRLRRGEALVDEVLATSPIGLRMTKEGLGHSIDAPSLEAAIAMENRNQLMCAASEDFKEGLAAFLEKRPPNYAGS